MARDLSALKEITQSYTDRELRIWEFKPIKIREPRRLLITSNVCIRDLFLVRSLFREEMVEESQTFYVLYF